MAPCDKQVVPFCQIQSIVNYVWKQEGLLFPPMVDKMPKQNHNGGDATRTMVRFREQTFTWLILHELAHSMSSTVDNKSNRHGALFMGIYIQLLSRYLVMSFNDLATSAEASGLHVKLDANPVF